MAKLTQELALLKAKSSEGRARLLDEPPTRPTRAQKFILQTLSQNNGSISAAEVHYKTGVLMTAQRWIHLRNDAGYLIYELTEAGADVLKSTPG